MRKLIFILLALSVPAFAQFGNATKLRGYSICGTFAPTDTQTLVYDGTNACWKASAGGGSTRTWLYAFSAVAQAGATGAGINLPSPSTTNFPVTGAVSLGGDGAGSVVDATHSNPAWFLPTSSTTTGWWVKIDSVPASVTGNWTINLLFWSSATTGAATLQTAYACIAPGAVTEIPTYSTTGMPAITLTPAGTTLQTVAASGTFAASLCAAGSTLRVAFYASANTIAANTYFQFSNLSVQAGM